MQRSEFADLVLEHQGRLRTFVRMLGVMPNAVDDLAQDTFVIAYERRELLKEIGQAGPWLRAIARNLVRNELRKSRRRRRIVNVDLTEAMLAESTENDAEYWSDGWLEALRHCVEQLPEHSRRLVNLRYGDGHSAAQVAADVGKTAVAVRQALARLRKLLRDCVEKRVPEVSS